MKKILMSIAVCSILVSCTKDLGTLQNLSTKEFKTDQRYELALKQQSYTANSLEACVNLALKAVPNSAFLRNAKVSSKGKKVTVITDVWSASKKRAQKNPELTLDKYKKPKGQVSRDRVNKAGAPLKVGMQVSWDHPKAGRGSGMISKISGDMAQIDKVVMSDGKPGKPVRLPVNVLKPMRK